MTFPLPPSALDQSLVFEFFWKFSAFECALKREGFLSSKPYADADWKRFGGQIKFDEVHLADFGEAVAKLKELAPMRQMKVNGQLKWTPVDAKKFPQEEQYVLELLKTARNNLFHGGKYPDGPVQEIARNCDVLRAALTVLDGCYELHLGIRARIDQIAA